jgi:hypothetical protein
VLDKIFDKWQLKDGPDDLDADADTQEIRPLAFETAIAVRDTVRALEMAIMLIVMSGMAGAILGVIRRFF